MSGFLYLGPHGGKLIHPIPLHAPHRMFVALCRAHVPPIAGRDQPLRVAAAIEAEPGRERVAEDVEAGKPEPVLGLLPALGPPYRAGNAAGGHSGARQVMLEVAAVPEAEQP